MAAIGLCTNSAMVPTQQFGLRVTNNKIDTPHLRLSPPMRLRVAVESQVLSRILKPMQRDDDSGSEFSFDNIR